VLHIRDGLLTSDERRGPATFADAPTEQARRRSANGTAPTAGQGTEDAEGVPVMEGDEA
jgi:hypothetical protein